MDTSIVIVTGEGVLESIDANLLKTLMLTKGWAKSLLSDTYGYGKKESKQQGEG